MIGSVRADHEVKSALRRDTDRPQAAEEGSSTGFAPAPSYPEGLGLLRRTAENSTQLLGRGRSGDPDEVSADLVAHRVPTVLRRIPLPGGVANGSDTGLPVSTLVIRPVPTVLRRTSQSVGVASGSDTGHRASTLVIRRYFDAWAAVGEIEESRKARFDTFVENAKAAGIAPGIAESAGLSAVQYWEGWSNPRLDDFDYPWIDGPRGFRTVLADRLKDSGTAPKAIGPLLDEVFKREPKQAELERVGRAAGFTPGVQEEVATLDLDPEWEAHFLDVFADRFERRGDWKGQGAAFRAAWLHATSMQKERILVILLGPGWQSAEDITPHLSDMSYLVEGVTGKTPKQPGDIQSWARAPKGSLFDYMLNVPAYDTKYMTEEERQQYRLTVHAGKVTRAVDEKPLVGDNIFVLSTNNVFYGGSKKSGRVQTGPEQPGEKTQALHHSSFLAGEPVSCAGHLITDGSGTLAAVSDQSGHYAPTDYEFGLFLYNLHLAGGADLAEVKFRNRPAEDFVREWAEKYLPQQEGNSDEESGTPLGQGLLDDEFDEDDPFKNPFV